MLQYRSEPELREQINAISDRTEVFHGFSQWLMDPPYLRSWAPVVGEPVFGVPPAPLRNPGSTLHIVLTVRGYHPTEGRPDRTRALEGAVLFQWCPTD